jgi:hypothetical protein
LLNILEKQSVKNKETDFAIAKGCLTKVSEDEGGDISVARILLNQIETAKQKISSAELPLLTELTFRSALHLSTPAHRENNERYPVIATKVGERSWGRILGGSALMFFGAVLITAAVLSGIASAGTSSLLSGLTAFAGKKMLIAGAVILGVGGIAAGVGGGYVATKHPYIDVANAANRFFHHRKNQDAPTSPLVPDLKKPLLSP